MNRIVATVATLAGAAGVVVALSKTPELVQEVNATLVLAKGILWTGSSPSF